MKKSGVMSLVIGGGEASAPAPPPSGDAPVYVMTISQSNIVGVATGTVNRAPNAKIWSGTAWVDLVFDTTGATSTNRGNTSTNIGPECAFAEAAAAYHGQTVYIIKEATASTSLDSASDWLATPISEGTKLAAALIEIEDALAALSSASIAYEVKGGISMIGETEAGVSAIVANRHGYNYQNAIKKVRDAVGLPYMRWVVARPYDNGAAGMTYISNIRAAEADLCGSGNATIYPDNLTLLDTDSFTRTSTNVHFTEAGYDDFGDALFTAVNVAPATISTFKLNQLAYIGPVYRSDVAASITKDGSNDVSVWADVSPAGWDMGQSGSAALKPDYNATGYNSIPSIDFSGAALMSTGTLVGDTSAGSRTIQVGANNAFSMIFVIAPNNPTVTGILMGKFGGASGSKAFYAGIINTEEVVALGYFNSAGTEYRGRYSLTTATNFSAQTWIISYDGTVDTPSGADPNNGGDRFKFYKNGTLIGSDPWINAGPLGDIQTANIAPLALGGACFSGEASAGSLAKVNFQFAALCGEAMDDARAAEIHTLLAAEFNI